MHSGTTGRWTPVALSADLPAKTVMPARIGAETIAIWRGASGQAAASADRCPHRGMRLSHGFVRGEALSCIYHGWRYAKAGNCLSIPAHPGLTPPEAIRVATFPVIEQDGLVWIGKDTPEGTPAKLDGLSPVRSLTVAATIGAIEAAAGASAGADGLLRPADALGGLCLLLSDLCDGQTLMHVLLAAKSTPGKRIAASRFAEALRRRAETLAVEGERP